MLGAPAGQRRSPGNRNVSSLRSTRMNAHRRSAVLAGTSDAPRVPGALTADAVRRHAYTGPPTSRPACRTRCLRAGRGQFIRFGRFGSNPTAPVIQPLTRAEARQPKLIANALRPAQPGADAPGQSERRSQPRRWSACQLSLQSAPAQRMLIANALRPGQPARLRRKGAKQSESKIDSDGRTEPRP
jgi:hypothetical protein